VLVRTGSPGRFRFGPFELDPETGELRKSGRKIHLQEKPLQILITLLERRGTLVSRNALRQRLWPAETFVDFDNGLNTAVSKLREVLGDSAGEHRYVETLARRGYRFVGAVEDLGALSTRVGRELDIAEKRIEPDIVVVPSTG
jgi:DNA-binding winged helix-turn-helix (wHTH) protein